MRHWVTQNDSKQHRQHWSQFLSITHLSAGKITGSTLESNFYFGVISYFRSKTYKLVSLLVYTKSLGKCNVPGIEKGKNKSLGKPFC